MLEGIEHMTTRSLEIRDGYALFWGQWPSNWEHSPFQLGGVHYNCVEQYMMAEKARLFGDMEVMNKILASPHPKAQKEFGRKVRGYDDEQWAKVRYKVVLKGTLEKYRQNPKLMSLLLATGDAVFVECSPEDTIWGIGMKRQEPDATNPEKWKGMNLLGKVITEARSIIRDEIANPRLSRESKQTVQWLDSHMHNFDSKHIATLVRFYESVQRTTAKLIIEEIEKKARERTANAMGSVSRDPEQIGESNGLWSSIDIIKKIGNIHE